MYHLEISTQIFRLVNSLEKLLTPFVHLNENWNSALNGEKMITIQKIIHFNWRKPLDVVNRDGNGAQNEVDPTL